MKTTDILKQQIFREAQNSGFFKNVQSQVKSYVYDIVQKESNNNREKLGFQYEHPLLSKLRKYPLTSLCMDLMQEFLESFKFKHTLNVFKKQINRNLTINRKSLAQQFRIQIKNPDSQAVLLSLVSQMVSGDVGTLKSHFKPQQNAFQQKSQSHTRVNNFIGQREDPKQKPSQMSTKIQQIKPVTKKQDTSMSFSNPSQSKVNTSKESSSKISQSNISNSINISSQGEKIKQKQKEKEKELEKQKQKEKQLEKQKETQQKKKKSKKQQIQKPPEAATDLLQNITKKFGGTIKIDKEQQKKQMFESKKAFSLQKEKKVVDPSESGANKIRGVSAGKTMNSFMSKFMPQAQQQKNQSYIDEQLDQFEQSKDSTRKNPLFSSSESGFDKSGFDQSVDSNAIEDYEYVERAKRFSKRL